MLRCNSQEWIAREFAGVLLARRRDPMVAVTYGDARLAPAAPVAKGARAKSAVPQKGWFARFVDALIEARMEQARRDIRMHTQLLPYGFDERGNRLVKSGSSDMRFGV
jgi:hypothetical protein